MKQGHSKLTKATSVLRRFALIAVAFTAAQFAFAANPTNGKTLWTATSISTSGQSCSSCHNPTPVIDLNKSWSASGTKLDQGLPSAITRGISNNTGGMGVFSLATTTQIADIAAYINASRFDNCLAAPGTTGVTGKTGAACSTSSTGLTTLTPCSGNVTWGTNSMCSAVASSTKQGSSTIVTYNNASTSTTGTATFACTATGAFAAATNATCTQPSACNPGSYSWGACTATSLAQAHGTTITIIDSTRPNTGTASLTCNNGISTVTAIDCNPALSCSASLSWTGTGGTCNALPAGGITLSGQTASFSDTTTPTVGTASAMCTDGSWGAATGSSCTVPVAAAPCAVGTSLSWNVGANSCSATLGANTLSGQSATLIGTNGQTTAVCSSGQLVSLTNTTCNAPVIPDCPAGAVINWSASGNACDATTVAAKPNTSINLVDSTGSTTGTAALLCNANGAWSATPTNTSCNAPKSCGAGPLSWTVGSNTCDGTAALTASGGSTSLSDAVGTTGAASFACNNGSWTQSAGATCAAAPLAACAPQAMSWTVGNNTCNATAGATASGASFSLSDSVAPTTGTAAALCTDGVWAAPTGGTCNAATGPRGVSSLNGESLWTTLSPASCAGCHGAKPDADLKKIWNASGTAAANDKGTPASIRSGINNPATGMGMYSAASDADLADIAAYVNAVRYGKPLTDGSGAAVVLPFIILQNGLSVGDKVVLPTIKFGAATTIKTTIAIQAPATGPLLITQMTIDNALFTINRVPVTAIDRQNMATSPPTSTTLAATTPTAVVIVQGTDQACPTTAFELQAGAACGLEVTMAVNNPGIINAKLLITTDAATTPSVINLGATVDAVATGGAGGGGCTMRSAPGLFDPMLLLLSVLSMGVLALRRGKTSRVESTV
jgi:cytochrome c553